MMVETSVIALGSLFIASMNERSILSGLHRQLRR